MYSRHIDVLQASLRMRGLPPARLPPSSHTVTSQDALGLSPLKPPIPEGAQDLIERFMSERESPPPMAYPCAPNLEDQPLSEGEYDRMVEEMTSRAWKRAWELYQIRSSASSDATMRYTQQAGGGIPTASADDGPEGECAAVESCNTGHAHALDHKESAGFDAYSSPLLPSRASVGEADFPQDAASRAANAIAIMAEASLLLHPATQCSVSGIHSTPMSCARGGRQSQRPSSYLGVHRVKTAQRS